MTRLHVTHRTEYRYESEVSSSYGQLHQLPRQVPGRQRCEPTTVTTDPAAADMRTRVDYFGNSCSFFHIDEPHTTLVVTATTVVELTPVAAHLPLDGALTWEEARAGIVGSTDPGSLAAREFILDSPLVAASEALADYARPSFPPGRPLVDAVRDLSRRIHTDFEFVPGATTVTTTIEEIFAARKGVCQDFAHVAIGCLRSMGLPGRYVSGYLETLPPPGGPRLVGADVSHAWVATYLPGNGWVDLDPTNDTVPDDRYVVTAWGRDYADVPPLKGVIFTDSTSDELRVMVDVVRLGDDL